VKVSELIEGKRLEMHKVLNDGIVDESPEAPVCVWDRPTLTIGLHMYLEFIETKKSGKKPQTEN
jgi:hypothetical protein